VADVGEEKAFVDVGIAALLLVVLLLLLPSSLLVVAPVTIT
jgi:hypothetical protein